MMKRICTGILTVFSLATVAAFAQSSSTPTTSTPVTGKTIQERKDNQQNRIGNGVENGSLTAGEAGRLENKEKNLNKEEHNMRTADDGKLTAADKAKLTRQQNRLSNNIYNQKHDAQVQPKTNNEVNTRDRNQQERIGQGIKSGQLTAGEASNLEKKETKLNKEERNDRAANGGKLTQGEKARINRQQNRASKQIYNKKHNGRKRG
ncbi:MAG TPA: hypothetical protein VFB76_07750 [Candidatus Angelobacter sp.]|nr:hypothetical protein [Candidatus Angelobacter sp.]